MARLWKSVHSRNMINGGGSGRGKVSRILAQNTFITVTFKNSIQNASSDEISFLLQGSLNI